MSTVDEQLLRGQSALLDLILGPVTERGESASASSASLAGFPTDTSGATGVSGTQPSAEVVKTSEERLRLMQPVGE